MTGKPLGRKDEVEQVLTTGVLMVGCAVIWTSQSLWKVGHDVLDEVASSVQDFLEQARGRVESFYLEFTRG